MAALCSGPRYQLTKAQATEEPPPKEERKKHEGIFQWAPKPRSGASPAKRLLTSGEGASGTPMPALSSAVDLLFMLSLFTKCLLQTDGKDIFESRTHTPGEPNMPSTAPCPGFGGRAEESVPIIVLETVLMCGETWLLPS